MGPPFTNGIGDQYTPTAYEREKERSRRLKSAKAQREQKQPPGNRASGRKQ